MNLEYLKRKNPGYNWLDCQDLSFHGFGRVLDYDATPAISKAQSLHLEPVTSSNYLPKVAQLENDAIYCQIKNTVFGGLPIQVGICYGHNSRHLGFECHQGSEVNVAITDMVLALAKKKGLPIKNESIYLVFVPRGTVVELFSETLHYCPLECDLAGFNSLVYLLNGTNENFEHAHGQLTKTNKWFTTHRENLVKVAQGNIIGMEEEVIEVSYR